MPPTKNSIVRRQNRRQIQFQMGPYICGHMAPFFAPLLLAVYAKWRVYTVVLSKDF